MKRPKRYMARWTQHDIVMLYLTGMPRPEIARRYGISQPRLHYILHARLRMPKRGGKKPSLNASPRS